METSFFYFSLVFLILNTFALISSTTLFNFTTDQEALVALKNAITPDPTGVLSKSWSMNTSICNWIGISCSIQHPRVIALNLSGFELQELKTIAPHLGNLTFLQSLDISSNNFTGSIPSELSNLRRLEEINLGFNNLTGDIPSWFGALSQLQHMHLNDNKFSGRIPVPLFNISRLRTLNMGHNLLDGNISDQVSNFYSLETLSLAENEFTGGIPSGIFTNMSSLVEIDMSGNQLSGQLPHDICSGNAPRLRSLDLTENQLDGRIPAGMYKCRKLERLILSANKFGGNIPDEIGNLTMLRVLSFSSNHHLQGNIPSSIFNISLLEYVDLSDNSLSGSIPAFNYLPQLEWLYLYGNNLTGHIPKQVGNLTSLTDIDLASNKLTGELPEEVGNLAYLENFAAPFNDLLYGSIPSSIFNMSTLKILSLQQNQFSGTLPSNIGLSLFNIEKLSLFLNRFSGEIPTSINNASKLTLLELNRNSFTGSIPDFGNLRLLQALRLWENNLTGAESPTQELKFISSLTNCQDLENLEISNNPLMNGILPASIGNLSTSLVNFLAYNCSIRGVIPSEIGNLSGLQVLDLHTNQLRGFIPTTIGRLKQLVKLYLYDNQLQGYIPRDLCQLSNLGLLHLSYNMLIGLVPNCLGGIKSLRELSFASNKLNSTFPTDFLNLTDLVYLDLSSNYLSGELPYQIERLQAINELYLSSNKFSGPIPDSIDRCKSLEFLSLANNTFSGSIPQSLGEVGGLRWLNLSKNDLSGVIPKSLEKLNFEYFDVSYNQLEGEIPNGGSFPNFTAESFAHNFALCGEARFQVPPCPENHGRSRSKTVSLIIKYILPPFIGVVILVIVIVFLIRRRKQKGIPPSAGMSSVGVAWKIVTERELTQGTSSFSETNLLGKGGFGSVFKAILSDETTVAVKVFNLQLEGALKSFDTESQILSTIRHRNLVRILGCCSNTQFKALILAYMPNGSLEKWLHSDQYTLDLMQRLNIAIDVALALEYLHHHHTFTVVHCDIKPNNVLLDIDMTAHVGDFGISKLFGDGEAMIHTFTMATIGYAAPEYGSEGKVSTSGDVYSYGILLLEMFTSTKPTDDMFSGEMSIKEWVGEALQENGVSEVVASGLLVGEDRHLAAREQCVSSIFELAMKCLAFSPEERINMMQVVAALQKFKVTVEAAIKRQTRS